MKCPYCKQEIPLFRTWNRVKSLTLHKKVCKMFKDEVEFEFPIDDYFITIVTPLKLF